MDAEQLQDIKDELTRCCMIDFYRTQTEEKLPKLEDVLEYFDKLSQSEEDVAVYLAFEAAYMQEANQ